MRILIADDSVLVRSLLREILSADPSFEIVGECSNGQSSVELCRGLSPDLMIMDVEMPILNGLEATRMIRSFSDIPILVFTGHSESAVPFRALDLGASDFLLKPTFETLSHPDYVEIFLERLRSLVSGKAPAPPPLPRRPREEELEDSPIAMIALGASTGGPRAIRSILSSLSPPLPLPFVVIQHIERGFDRSFASWLAAESGHPALLAADGARAQAGSVYIAPTDRHLTTDGRIFHLEDGPPVLNQKPSIDVFLSSLAQALGPASLAVLLTGMGRDGAAGCRAILDSGGSTIVQDHASSLIYGMPKAAIEAGGAGNIIHLDGIGPAIAARIGAKTR